MIAFLSIAAAKLRTFLHVQNTIFGVGGVLSLAMRTKETETLHCEVSLPVFDEYSLFIAYGSDAVAEIAIGSSASYTACIDNSTDSNSGITGVCAA